MTNCYIDKLILNNNVIVKLSSRNFFSVFDKKNTIRVNYTNLNDNLN